MADISTKRCSVPECMNRHYGLGLCQKHYMRLREHGTVNLTRGPRVSTMKCSIDGCEKKQRARGLCCRHWWRWRKYGDPNAKVKKLRRPVRTEIEFWTCTKRSGECLEWVGARTYQGYGVTSFTGRNMVASRVSYALSRGPIPDGYLVLHSCDNPACINPDHLRLGTQADNMHDRMMHGHYVKGYRSPSGTVSRLEHK